MIDPTQTQQVLIGISTERLLFANGIIDRELGKSINEGWADLCMDAGWEDCGRTPAKEKYEDGWYSVKVPVPKNLIF
jgi:hypothetical protein